MKVKVTQSCLTLCKPMDYIQSLEFSRPEYWVGILPSQGSNPGLPHCRWFYTKYYLNTKYLS